MSETHGAEGADVETFDLTDVPMDGDDAPVDGAGEGDDDPDGEEKPAARKPAAGQEPLAPEELSKRYDNTRTALAEERRARRAVERELESYRSGERAPSAPQQRQARVEPEADIDPEDDPIGALKQMRAKVAAYEKAEQQENLTATQQQAQERQLRAVEADLSEHEADFRDENPDYDDAAKHYAGARAQELMSFGLAPQQVQTVLRKEFVDLASSAIRARKNPAAVIYQLAKGRGFGTKVADEPKKPGKLDALARGQRTTSPLSRSGGRPSNGLDAVTVSNINIHDPKGAEAFDKAWAAMEREAKRNERGR